MKVGEPAFARANFELQEGSQEPSGFFLDRFGLLFSGSLGDRYGLVCVATRLSISSRATLQGRPYIYSCTEYLPLSHVFNYRRVDVAVGCDLESFHAHVPVFGSRWVTVGMALPGGIFNRFTRMDSCLVDFGV